VLLDEGEAALRVGERHRVLTDGERRPRDEVFAASGVRRRPTLEQCRAEA